MLSCILHLLTSSPRIVLRLHKAFITSLTQITKANRQGGARAGDQVELHLFCRLELDRWHSQATMLDLGQCLS